MADNFEEVVLTAPQLWDQAEKLAKEELGIDAVTAFERLKQGAYDGTILESELLAIWYLLGLDKGSD